MLHHNDNLAETHPYGDRATITRQPGTGIPSDPWQEILTLQRGLDALVGRLFGSSGLHGTASEGQPGQAVCIEPDVDIYESAQDFVLHIALPGMEPEHIQVHVTPHRILVTAQPPTSFDERKEVAPEQATDPERDEQSSTFVTVWQLGPVHQPHRYTRCRQSRYSVASRFAFEHTFLEAIVPEQVQARLRHGRLDLHLPKLKPGIEQAVRVAIHVHENG